jgi:UDP-N-acetylmuramate dehydrogenase
VTRLADYTTLHLGGPAGRFVTASADEDLVAAVSTPGDPVLILGGGSNLVVSDDGFPGTVVRVATRGIQLDRASGDQVDVTVAAGEPWEEVVEATVAEGLAGLECLSGIPGLTGATPIQNVGAYGQEVADVVTTVRVFDRQTTQSLIIPNGGCQFGYRTSLFKSGGTANRFLVLGVTFRLTEQKLSRPVRYPDMAAELGVQIGEQVPAADARAAVIAVRSRKGMVIDPVDPDTRSAGSFFTNPVVSAEQFAAVEEAARDRGVDPVPRYDAGEGQLKVPAAWLIERSGFTKGYVSHGARISTKHTLALTNPGTGASAGTTFGLLALAREIRDGVHTAFGVTLEPEPTFVGVTL